MRMMFVAAALCLLGCSNAHTDPEALGQGLGGNEPPTTSPVNASSETGKPPPTATCPGKPATDEPDCAVETKACYAKGGDAEDCEQLAIDCKNAAVPDAPEDCKELVATCDKQAMDPETCKLRAVKCEGKSPQAGGKPGAPGDKNECVKVGAGCKEQGTDAKPCEIAEKCGGEPGTKPGKIAAPADPEKCAELVAACSDTGIDPKTCDEIAAKCEQAIPL